MKLAINLGPVKRSPTCLTDTHYDALVQAGVPQETIYLGWNYHLLCEVPDDQVEAVLGRIHEISGYTAKSLRPEEPE